MEYKLTATEFSKMLGLSTSGLRKKRLRGELEGAYRFSDGKYLYLGLRDYQLLKAGQNSKVERGDGALRKIKRIVRRGTHVQGQQTRYPNKAFENYNYYKMLAKAQRIKNGHLITKSAADYAEKNYLKENEQRALSLEKDFNKTKVYAHWTNAYAPISTTRRSKKKTFNYY